NDGKWLGYQLVPNEGDATAVFRATSGTTERRFPMGEVNAPNGPTGTLDISGDSRWALFTVAPLRRDAEKARLAHRPIETKAALVNLATGEKKEFDRVRRFAFLGDHPRWVALSAYPQDAGAAAPAAAPAPAGGRGGANAAPARVEASDLLLYNLDSGELVNIGNVGEFAVDDAGQYLAYTIETRDRMGDGVQLRDLKSDVVRALESDRAIYRHLAWADSGLALAVVKLAVDSAARDTAVSVVAFTGFGANGPKKTVLAGTGRSDIASGLAISPDRAPKWSRDLATVYVGLRHAPRPAPRGPEQGNNLQSLVRPGAPGMGGTMNMPQTGAPTDEDLPSLILWHWKDPRLQSQQIVEEARDKRYSYLAAYRVADDKVTRLADDSVREVTVAPGDRYAYALDEQPYLNQASSTGRAFVDIYTIDVRTGARSKRVSKVITRASASPDGRHLMYWGMDAQWHVIDMATGDERSMTKDLPVTFANVEDDHYNLVQPPEPVVGWSKDGAWALLSDGWDVWKVSVSGAPAVNLTGNGRRDKVRYQRRVFVDPKEQGIDLRKPLFFQIYGEWTKKAGLARVDGMKGGATRLMWDDAAFNFVRAKDADAVLYSRSTFVD
ncbi:MAG TPA: hypothetical protein VG818_02985, partial [Gemmatimonadaceae bacterium]|nr:hypothetical protein [Gemmatimonadaceae bacterium]